ncbi:TlpA family protein disulfide reductase [Streptomyces marokkonensis]|uniref:TlpA family protein disulfide reductase n=1 Tax=Streptomyces marokkonensis TaxID=324855 RepID=UPI0011F0D213|nr:hypothetical protein [Streptomyces marokkonensis]
MAYLTAGLVLVALLCVLDLVLTLAVVRRLREEPATAPDGGGPPDVSELSVGEVVAPFEVTDTAGRTLTRDGLTSGMNVVFMSPGCLACEELLPLVAERAAGYAPGRLLAVVVRDPDGSDGHSEFVDRLSPVARVVVTDLGGALMGAFALTGTPAYVEMGHGGRISGIGRTLPRPAAQAAGRPGPVGT